MAGQAQDVQDLYRDEGFQYIELISGDLEGNAPSRSDLRSWADRYGMTDIPVLGFTAADMDSLEDLCWQWEYDMYIPTMYVLGPDMTVLSADEMATDPGPWM